MTPGAAGTDAGASDSVPSDGGAAPSPLEVLAQIADLDVRLGQITHHVTNLPERETRAGIEAELGAFASEARALDAQIAGLERQQRRHEDEVALIETKRAHNSERLYDSHLTSPKEAEALTAEAASLGRRQMEIEDQILELMEELEPLSQARADLAARETEAAQRMDSVDAAIAAAECEADSERRAVHAQRAELVAAADGALVSTYEQRRSQSRGAPVLGRLVGTTCTACHLDLPSVEHERITRLDPAELAECPECGALLVR